MNKIVAKAYVSDKISDNQFVYLLRTSTKTEILISRTSTIGVHIAHILSVDSNWQHNI